MTAARPRPAGGTPRATWSSALPLLGVLALALTVAFPYFEATRNANERPRLLQAVAVVDDGSLAIDGVVERGFDPGPDTARRGPAGELYPNKPPGASLVAVPAYGLHRLTAAMVDQPATLRGLTWWARLFAGVLPTLVLVAVAWRRFSREHGEWPTALAILLYALATPANAYAHLFYGHQLAAACLFLGVGWLADAREGAPWPFAVAGGAIAAASVGVEYAAVFAGVPIAVTLLRGAGDARGRRVVGAALAGALVPILLLGWYHESAFGSPFATGYHHAVDPSFARKHAEGLLGLGLPTWDGVRAHILSPSTGLIAWAPLFPLALLGLLQLAFGPHERRVEARLHLAVFVVLLVVGCGLSFEGGWRVGPRYIVVALPGLILGWTHALAQLRTHPIAMGVVACIATWSLLVNVLAANLWPHIDATNIHGPVSEVLIPLLVGGYQPYGPLWLAGVTHGSWWILVVSALVVAYALFRCCEPGYRMMLASSAGLACGVYCVFGLAEALTPPHPRARRNLEYIMRVYEPRPHEAHAEATAPLTADVVPAPRER